MSGPTTTIPSIDLTRGDSVSGGASALSVRRREFARHFVESGGNGTKAAALAGYSESDLHKAGQRALLNPQVLAEIKRLSMVNIGQWIPFAITVLVEIAANPETPAKDRIAAVNSLLDRSGMAAPKGGVQVNVGVQVNGNDVQTLIGSIWAAKQGSSSDIDAAMSDSSEVVEGLRHSDLDATPIALLEQPAAMGGGGVQFQGPPPAGSNIPPSPSAPCQKLHGLVVDPFGGYSAMEAAREERGSEQGDTGDIRATEGSREGGSGIGDGFFD